MSVCTQHSRCPLPSCKGRYPTLLCPLCPCSMGWSWLHWRTALTLLSTRSMQITAQQLAETQPDPIPAIAPGIIKHMNDDHADSSRAIVVSSSAELAVVRLQYVVAELYHLWCRAVPAVLCNAWSTGNICNARFLAVLLQEHMGGLKVETAQISRLDGLGMDLVCTRKGQQIAVRVNYLRCSVHQ